MPRYLVGHDANYYSANPLDFRAEFIVTTDSLYSRPILIEPYEPFEANDQRQAEFDEMTALWIEKLDWETFGLWAIWSTKTVVTEIDGNVLFWEKDRGQGIGQASTPQEEQRARRRVPRRG